MNNMASYSMWYVIIVHDWFFYTGKKEFLEKQKDYLKGVADLLSAHIDEKGQDTVKEGRFLDWPSEGKKKIGCRRTGDPYLGGGKSERNF